jgi:2-polyprenyl-6-methoxyphenol hydroxylase-like FAD-dependent oxidoreductase
VNRKALVIGGSVGGLFTANLLRQIGWQAIVFERSQGRLADRGTGIGTRPELFAVMRRIGISIDASIGVDVRSRICLDRDGTIAREQPVAAVTSSWAHIYRRLLDALPTESGRPGMALARVEQDARSVTAIFADGTRVEGDLLIGADGLNSTVRRQFLPDVMPRYAGYVAWRAAVAARDIPPALHTLVLHHMIFCFPDRGLMLSIPMPSPDDDGRGCHFVWFRPVPEADLAALCTDAEGRSHGTSIPPPLIRRELIDEVKASAAAELAPQLAALVVRAPQLIMQPIFDLESPRLAFGRVALLGDAAFVARPHVATGVTKAALDAQCLAHCLSDADDLESALARYDEQRKRFGQWLVARGRHIGATLMARADGGEERASQVEMVMREYGAAGVVDDEAITARDVS